MKNALIAIVAAVVLVCFGLALTTHGNTGVWSKDKAVVEKFEDRQTKITCFVLMNGKSPVGISCK